MAKSSLINKLIPNLYGGMSEQVPARRFDNQVDYMYNCVPTVGQGTKRRNPTVSISDAEVQADAFVHSYQSGLTGAVQESYSISFDNTNGIQVTNLATGRLMTVQINDNADEYLKPFSNKSRYSALTIGDTTIMSNADVVVDKVLSTSQSTWTGIDLIPCFAVTSDNCLVDGLAPHSTKGVGVYTIKEGAVTTLTIDGTDIAYKTNVAVSGGWFYFSATTVDTIYDWVNGLYRAIQNGLDSEIYNVEQRGESIYIQRAKEVDGTPTAIAITNLAITWTSDVGFIHNDPTETFSNFITQGLPSDSNEIPSFTAYEWEYTAYVVIEDYDYTNPYTHSVTIDGETWSATGSTSTAGSTVDTATKLALAINTASPTSEIVTGATNILNGTSGQTVGTETNVIKIFIRKFKTSQPTVQVNPATEYVDTFGNHAGFAFNKDITALVDLPLKFGHVDSVVRIVGNKREEGDDYWVYYDGNSWVETSKPEESDALMKNTMPIIIQRDATGKFVVDKVGYSDRHVGDDNSNAMPSFVGHSINDMFLFKNRLGFVSRNNVTLSGVDDLFNFFRPTVQSRIESERIDVSIDTKKYVDIKYAVPLDNFVMLFSDTQQFRFEYSGALTADTVSAKLATSYELNTEVRPILVDNRIYFIVRNNDASALMEYFHHFTSDSKVLATNVTSHLPNFLPHDIDYMEANVMNNQLFIKSKTNNREIAVYNYLFNGQDRLQSAWHIWGFSADINSMFGVGDKLYMFTQSFGEVSAIDWCITDALWNDNEVWRDEAFWDDGTTIAIPEYVYMDLKPYNIDDVEYLDTNNVPFQSTVILSTWVYNPSGELNTRANLLFKNVQVEATDDSSVNMLILNYSSNKLRLIQSDRVVNERVLSTGKASQVKIQLENDLNKGFQIETISYEGSVSSRSRNIK